MAADNVHATALVFGGHGVLITGPSGSGKTGLALALLGHARLWGFDAGLVCDDQVLLGDGGGRLVATAPAAIAGLVEVRGVGPVAIPHRASVVVDLVVRLVPHQQAPRLPQPAHVTSAGIPVAELSLAMGDRAAAVMAVAAHFGLPPFAAS